MSMTAARKQAVATTLGIVRSIIKSQDVSRDELTQVRDCLIELAKRHELFPWSDFPLPPEGETERTYRLSQDPDGGFALYVNCGRQGQTYPPHNHATWAVVVSVCGNETHRIYRRIDDGSQPGIGRLEGITDIQVTPGRGVAMLAQDIHSIHAVDEEPLLHLHLYGQAIENQKTRKEYDLERGTCTHNNDIGLIEDAPERRG